MSKKKKPATIFAAEQWKDLKRSLKPKRRRIYGNKQDEKKPGELLTDAKQKKKGN